MVGMQHLQRVPDEFVQVAGMRLDLDAALGREQHDRRLPHVVDPPGEIAFGLRGDCFFDQDVRRQPIGPHPVDDRGGDRACVGLSREPNKPALAARAGEHLRLDRGAAGRGLDRFVRAIEASARHRQPAPLQQRLPVGFDQAHGRRQYERGRPSTRSAR